MTANDNTPHTAVQAMQRITASAEELVVKIPE
jgi:hypothetical protein